MHRERSNYNRLATLLLVCCVGLTGSVAVGRVAFSLYRALLPVSPKNTQTFHSAPRSGEEGHSLDTPSGQEAVVAPSPLDQANQTQVPLPVKEAEVSVPLAPLDDVLSGLPTNKVERLWALKERIVQLEAVEKKLSGELDASFSSSSLTEPVEKSGERREVRRQIEVLRKEEEKVIFDIASDRSKKLEASPSEVRNEPLVPNGFVPHTPEGSLRN